MCYIENNCCFVTIIYKNYNKTVQAFIQIWVHNLYIKFLL